jgi:hypothetical protein
MAMHLLKPSSTSSRTWRSWESTRLFFISKIKPLSNTLGLTGIISLGAYASPSSALDVASSKAGLAFLRKEVCTGINAGISGASPVVVAGRSHTRLRRCDRLMWLSYGVATSIWTHPGWGSSCQSSRLKYLLSSIYISNPRSILLCESLSPCPNSERKIKVLLSLILSRHLELSNLILSAWPATSHATTWWVGATRKPESQLAKPDLRASHVML